jgi:predicted RNA-binding Zn ribbon-like protein
MTEPLSIELANTLEGGPRGVTDTLDDRWGADARPLRDAIRTLFEAAIAGADPDQRAVAILNAAPRGLSLVWQAGKAPALDGELLSLAATSAISVLAGPDRELLRHCEAAPCIRLFLADDPRRQYCSATCGTRVRAARLRERRAASSPD